VDPISAGRQDPRVMAEDSELMPFSGTQVDADQSLHTKTPYNQTLLAVKLDTAHRESQNEVQK